MRLAILALVLAGCGGSDVTYTCTVMSTSAAQCTEYRVSASQANEVSQRCATEKGTIVETPCDDADSFGTCKGTSNGIDYDVWVYASAGVPDAATAKAYCTSVLEGTWTATK